MRHESWFEMRETSLSISTQNIFLYSQKLNMKMVTKIESENNLWINLSFDGNDVNIFFYELLMNYIEIIEREVNIIFKKNH